ALASTAGRCGLAVVSERWGRRLETAQQRANVSALGQWLNSRADWRKAVAVMVYSLGPIPSNQIFIAAGLSGVGLTPRAAGFLAGRLVSYPVLAATARGATDHLRAVLTGGWRDPRPSSWSFSRSWASCSSRGSTGLASSISRCPPSAERPPRRERSNTFW